MKAQKFCNKCKRTKLISNFYRDNSRKDGHATLCKLCSHESVKRWRKTRPDLRFKRILKLHNIDEEIFLSFIKLQKGSCAICSKEEKKLYIDHDHSCCPGSHSCGKCVRGLLCSLCNMYLGRIDEDPIKISNYLKRRNKFGTQSQKTL